MRRFAVLKQAGGWGLFDPSGPIEHFASCGSARRTAEALARATRRLGHDVELLVQAPGGEVSRVNVPVEIH